MTAKRTALANKLRRQGKSLDEIGKELGGFSRQYVFQLLNPEKVLLKSNGENFDILNSLKIDRPIFIPNKTKTPDLYKCTSAMNIKVVIKEVVRKGVPGLWFCRVA